MNDNLSRFSIILFFILSISTLSKVCYNRRIQFILVLNALPFIISILFGKRDTLGRRDTMRCRSTEFDLIFFGVIEPVFLKFSTHLFMQYSDGYFTFLLSLALNFLWTLIGLLNSAYHRTDSSRFSRYWNRTFFLSLFLVHNAKIMLATLWETPPYVGIRRITSTKMNWNDKW